MYSVADDSDRALLANAGAPYLGRLVVRCFDFERYRVPGAAAHGPYRGRDAKVLLSRAPRPMPEAVVAAIEAAHVDERAPFPHELDGMVGQGEVDACDAAEVRVAAMRIRLVEGPAVEAWVLDDTRMVVDWRPKLGSMNLSALGPATLVLGLGILAIGVIFGGPFYGLLLGVGMMAPAVIGLCLADAKGKSLARIRQEP